MGKLPAVRGPLQQDPQGGGIGGVQEAGSTVASQAADIVDGRLARTAGGVHARTLAIAASSTAAAGGVSTAG
jgi:hypothetical protein